jgi:hypothetical protein
VINLKNRLDIYLDSNYDNIQFRVTDFASNLVDDLGVYPIDIDWPVLSELYNLRFASLFLGIVLNLIIFVLFVLSCMLLYNLLLVSVETKTYEQIWYSFFDYYIKSVLCISSCTCRIFTCIPCTLSRNFCT